MKHFRKATAIVLTAALLLTMAPVMSVSAAGRTGLGGLGNKDSKKGDGTEAAANEVLVLYEEGEIPAAPSGSKAKKSKGVSPESAQEKIIENALDGDFSIDDTIVIETQDESAEDMVVGVVSSPDYSAEEMADILQKADGVRLAEPNYRYTINAVADWNDTYIKDSWQLGERGVNADKAPAAAGGSDPVVLAVMDTGIDYEHPDLKDRMWTAPAGFALKGEHGVDWSDKDDDPMDENGHGTHCAGIIAAAANNSEGIAGVAGAADNVQLMGVRVLDAEGGGYLEDIVRGYKYLIRAKNEGVNIKAVNCSLGAEATSDIFDEVIEQAGKAGILTIASAGNETSNNDSTNVSPANSKSDYVVVVAATDDDGSLASYSNYGRKNVDVAAPGSNILSSVSYYNYAPYLYDAGRLKDTTRVYGEFGGASVETDADTGEQSVTPVLGTAYDGADIEDVESFGASKLWSAKGKGSSGEASLEITDGGEGSFVIGNNQKSLRWKISNAKEGDQYVLYFPYEKLKGNPLINMVFSTYAGEGDNDGSGVLLFGDVKIDDVDAHGNVSFSTSAEENMNGVYVDPTWNGIWQASGVEEALYDRVSVKDLEEGMYGLGFVYEAYTDGDVYIDISSLAISQDDADPDAFGAYDVYSGTSMAAPVVTGAAGLIAAAEPDIDAEALKATILGTTVSSSALSGKCSTGGKVDFSAYSGEPESARPSISSVNADFAGGTVTIKGRGFGETPVIKAFRNTAAEGEDGEISLDAADVQVSGGDTITISKAGYDDYGLIGSDIRFEISNGEKTGEGSYYIVKGLTPYDDVFTTAYEADDEFFIWGKDADKADVEDEEEDWEEEEPEDPTMPSGLSYVSGSNDLYKYNSYGDIYHIERNETNGKYYPVLIGDAAGAALDAYVEEISEEVDYWKPDEENGEGLNYYLVGAPVYSGNVIYELLCADMVDRDAYVLMGIDLNEEEYTWNVYYDSLAGLGTKPDELDFRQIENATLAAYNGRIYMLGGNSQEKYDEATEEYSVEICKSFFSCEPDTDGTAWKYEGELPVGVTNGRAMASNGKLYYFLTNDADGRIDYSIYSFDGTSWTKAGEIPEALFADSDGLVIKFVGDMLEFSFDDTDRIFCAAGIDSKGIVFAGKSFDGPGDTFRFNTETNKIEPLKYSLWETVSDRAVDGAAMGEKFYVEYSKESTSEAVCKSFPIKSGYVNLEKSVYGDGQGVVMGGGSYAKGDKAKITIKPEKGSYIYSVSSKGLSPELNKEYGKATAESTKTLTTTYNANKDASLEVEFGFISTKVIIPAQSFNKYVGKRSVNAYTDGTISDVRWQSGNKKYAKVNSDGTITFKKAGIGKTVTLTAVSVENPKLKASCKVKILSREKTKFKWNGKKLTTKSKVQIDLPLARKCKPKKFKVKNKGGKAVLSWKKAKGVSGYIVLRRAGKGRFTQIAKVSAGTKKYTDKSVKKGKKYRYIVVGYKKVKGSKAIRISRAIPAKRLK